MAASEPPEPAKSKKKPKVAAPPAITSTDGAMVIERKAPPLDTSGRYLYYPGAKETILDVVLRLIPPNAVRLIEPFTGSGALASGLAFRFREVEASDLNAELIEAHRRAIGDTDDFVAELDRLFSAGASGKRWFYDAVREAFNASDNLAAKAAFLVFMNRKGFKGLMRRNSKGEFNVPFWEERADQPLPKAQIDEFSERLADKARFTTQDFGAALDAAGRGDFCYLDPPYLAEQGKDGTFAEYVGAFTQADHERMAALCKAAADRGATVVVSNHDSNLARSIYRSATRIYVFDVPRGMSDATGKGDSVARELLAVWMPKSAAALDPFIRKPPLGAPVDPFGWNADIATLQRRVFKIAKAHGWLKAGAKADAITNRSLRENGTCLLAIAHHGSPKLRRLALDNPERAPHLSLHLLESLILTERRTPPLDLMQEDKAATVLLDLAERLEAALADHPLADKAFSRVLTYKARHYIARDPALRLPVECLPERYRAALDAIRAREWGFDSEPAQRLLVYADLCEDRGSKAYIALCKAVGAGVPLKTLLECLPSQKAAAGRGLGAGHRLVTAGQMRGFLKALPAVA